MIIHLDADAFFVSVEQAADRRLRGRPVAVGGQKRGIIASASYEARKLGVYTPMPSAKARKICPELLIIPGDYAKYEQFSRFMFSFAYDFTSNVEIASIDEGYFDLGAQTRYPAREVAARIRDAIAGSLKLSASFGIASNKLVSQVASKLKKPGGFLEVPTGEERSFLAPLAPHWLPGIGNKAAATLTAAGFQTVDQIARTPPEELVRFVGSYAPQLCLFAQGIDDRPVISEHSDAKSYSEQETFGENVQDEAFILATARAMADRLMTKVRADRKTVRTITVRLRYHDFSEASRGSSLEEPTDLETEVYATLERLVKKAWTKRAGLRLVSVRLSQIYPGLFSSELPLDPAVNTPQQKRDLAQAIDALRSRFGTESVMRGHDLWLKAQEGRQAGEQ
jgi:nucleotidyltransferase/DNA polymerase involved in DNA repair